MIRKTWRSRKVLIGLGLCGLLCFLCVVSLHRQHALRLQREKTALILSTLGSRNTSQFVKPGENTIVFDCCGTRPLLSKQHQEGDKENGNFHVGNVSAPSLLNTQTQIQAASKKVPFALIVVLSQVGKEKNRLVIRKTWYQWAQSLDVKIIFFLGIPPNGSFSMAQIEKESQEFNDIMVDDFVENYYLLAVKVLRILKWFQATYTDEDAQPDFLIKTDDDVFIHLPNLVNHLKKKVDITNYMGGVVHHEAPVIRDGDGKWFTPYELWNLRVFPSYLSGPCYYIAGAFVGPLYEASLTLPLFHLEDVFLSGFVAKLLLNNQLDALPKNRGIHSSDTKLLDKTGFHQIISFHAVDSAKAMQNYYRMSFPTTSYDTATPHI